MVAAVQVKIPVRTVSEANRRGHWASHERRRKNHRGSAMLLTRVAVAGNGKRRARRITFTRVAPRFLDVGNLAMSVKAVQDGVCDALGVDDGPAGGIEWDYGQRRSQPGEGYAVLVDIEWSDA